MASCPECGKDLPWGDAYQPGGGFGLPDKRTLDCPYCGAPLEPFRWTDFLVLAAVLAVLMAARKIIGPLISDELLVIGVAVVITYHLLQLWKRRISG